MGNLSVEFDPRVEEIRKLEKRVRDAKYELTDAEVALTGSLGDFYALFRAAEMLEIDPRLLTTLIRNGAVFGMKVNGKWYVEKIDVDYRTEFV